MTTLQAAVLTWPTARPAEPVASGRLEGNGATARGACTAPTAGREVRPSRLPWLCCALVSLAAHAAVLNALDTTPASWDRHVATAGPAPAARHAMQFRTVTAPPRRPAPAAPTADAAPTPHAAPLDVAAPAPAPVVRHEAVMPPSSQGDDPHDRNEAALPPPGPATYFPRSELTVVPAPLHPVILATPDDGGPPARRVGVLSLFIDEAGRVHHIVPEEPLLPSRYEEAAREAFMAAAFTPGERDGGAVKSRIRIEVVFDNTPLDAP